MEGGREGRMKGEWDGGREGSSSSVAEKDDGKGLELEGGRERDGKSRKGELSMKK